MSQKNLTGFIKELSKEYLKNGSSSNDWLRESLVLPDRVYVNDIFIDMMDHPVLHITLDVSGKGILDDLDFIKKTYHWAYIHGNPAAFSIELSPREFEKLDLPIFAADIITAQKEYKVFNPPCPLYPIGIYTPEIIECGYSRQPGSFKFEARGSYYLNQALNKIQKYFDLQSIGVILTKDDSKLVKDWFPEKFTKSDSVQDRHRIVVNPCQLDMISGILKKPLVAEYLPQNALLPDINPAKSFIENYYTFLYLKDYTLIKEAETIFKSIPYIIEQANVDERVFILPEISMPDIDFFFKSFLSKSKELPENDGIRMISNLISDFDPQKKYLSQLGPDATEKYILNSQDSDVLNGWYSLFINDPMNKVRQSPANIIYSSSRVNPNEFPKFGKPLMIYGWEKSICFRNDTTSNTFRVVKGQGRNSIGMEYISITLNLDSPSLLDTQQEILSKIKVAFKSL